MKKAKKFLASIICLSLMLAALLPIQIMAADVGNEAVKTATKGVVQVLVTYTDAEGNVWTISSGSGFFIGSENGADTIVTNNHVVSIDAESRQIYKDFFGRDIINDLEFRVAVDRDLSRKATLTDLNSAEYDIAVLKLDSPLPDKEILSLSTTEPEKTQSVYALGYPAVTEIVKDKAYYTAEDVTITTGTISYVTEIGQTQYIQHECTLTSGNSGGPLVDENGVVVGINTAGVEDNYFYSVKVSELIKLLDKMGMSYNGKESIVSGGNTDDSEVTEDNTQVVVDTSALSSAIDDAEAKLEEGKWTEDSVSYLEAAIESAKEVLNDTSATQERVDSAANDVNSAADDLEEEKGLPIVLIAGIVAAVVIIVVIIIAVVNSSKKKKATASAPAHVPPTGGPAPSYAPPTGGPTPPYAPMGGGMPSIDMGGADETSVLNEGAGQTTVLSAQAVPTATLKRKATGETAIINKAVYLIGKERSKVDFCISNNSSVSRIHVKIIFENGVFYVEDQNATNFTFVNGNKVNPGQRVKVMNGDKIKISDEEFEFKA